MKLVMQCVVSCIIVAACSKSPNPSSSITAMEAVRTDAAPIAKRLPKLGELQSVWWTSRKVTLDSALSPPEHPGYRVCGFAELEKEKASQLSEQFQWERTPFNWMPSLTLTNLNLNSAEWSRSSPFTKDYKPQQIPGELFFERKMGIVYFDLEIE